MQLPLLVALPHAAVVGQPTPSVQQVSAAQRGHTRLAVKSAHARAAAGAGAKDRGADRQERFGGHAGGGRQLHAGAAGLQR